MIAARKAARKATSGKALFYCSCGAPVVNSGSGRLRHAERSPKCREEMGI